MDYNGTTLPAGATQNFNFTNWQGCDSVVSVVVLGNLPGSSAAISAGVCPGETFVYQGITLTAGSVQNFTLTNAVGCDSVVTVTVFQKNISSNVIEVKVCPGETYLFQGVEIAAGDSREFHFVNSELCDSTVIVFVLAHPATVFGLNTTTSCSNIPSGVLEATGLAGGPAPYRFSLDDINYQTEPRFEDLSAGAYTLYIEDGNGCIFEQNGIITAIPKLEVRLLNGILPCDSAGIQLFAEILSGDPTGLTYQWWNGQNTPVSTAFEAGNVWVEVTDACETIRSEASVQWAELAEDQDIVYIPNVFMPSARDALNASFKPFFAAGITLLVMLVSLPLVGALTELNKMIPVPASMETLFRQMEDAYEKQVKIMSKMDGFGDYFLSIIVMALGPAIFEETFFRGGLQNILHKWTGRKWMPLIITSVVFSAIHFSYYGFIPRMALGIILGLLYLRSGSLWMSILAHFINNAFVVTVIFYLTSQGRPIEDAMEDTDPLWVGAVALVAIVCLFMYYKKFSEDVKKRKMPVEDRALEEQWLA